MGFEDESVESLSSETDESYVADKEEVRYKGDAMTKRKKEEKDENVHYIKGESNATCRIDEIEGFIYGASSSRFWMLRKHVNSTDINPSIQ